MKCSGEKEDMPERSAGSEQKRILVVEEEKIIRELLSLVLSKMGYVATFADNGKNGAECFRKGKYHLVLSDLTMPFMDGWSLALWVKKQSPHTPFILMTGWGEWDVLPKIRKYGVDCVVFKPVSCCDLKKTIESLI